MLARALPSILPAMTVAESLDVTKIYSVRGLLPAETPLLRERPFRAPHHTTSYVGLVGGGSWPRPGEISLAHRGVLFLDELPEFGATKLEGLRQPLEDRTVTLARAAGTLTFPANFTLIAAMNPCPCGYYGDPRRACSCAPGAISRYQKRINGPLLDRIDIHLDVPRIPHEQPDWNKVVGLPPPRSVNCIRRVANVVAKPKDKLGLDWKYRIILGGVMGRSDDPGHQWTALLRICKQQVRSSSLLVGS
jgi:predicted ATPase with chaperone activity